MHQARRGGHGIKKCVVKVKQRDTERTIKYGTLIWRSNAIIQSAAKQSGAKMSLASKTKKKC